VDYSQTIGTFDIVDKGQSLWLSQGNSLVNLFTRKKVGGAKAVFTFHPTAGRSPDPARVLTSHRPADSAMGDLCTAQETLIACRLTTNAGIASAISAGRRRKP
jgi:hypothetical protein